MSALEFAALRADIKVNGVREPIWLFHGELLDGRHRVRACEELGVACPERSYDGDDPVGFVVSLNLKRRHLSESQRAMVAEKLATARQGERTDLQPSANLRNVSRPNAAALLNVSPRLLDDARAVRKASPELAAEVERGEKTVTQAKREIQHTERRDAPSLPTAGKYRVLYADPPWDYGNSGLRQYGHASHHYPSLTIPQLCALPVAGMAETDAVLFLWVTSPLLAECFAVVRAWGFTYKTSFVWDKVKHNFGHYNSVRHEFLLVCTRGACTPDVATLYDSVQTIERSKTHSEKPEEFRAIIDAIYPNGQRLELFSRNDHAGWETWGNEPAA